MTLLRRATLPALLLGALAGGCQPAPNRASRAVSVACRAEVDRVYAAQNRAELSERDQRDTPFAGSYNSGVTSRGLSSLYGRDNMLESCVRNAQNGNSAAGTAGPSGGGPAPSLGPASQYPGTGPTFSPANR